MTAQTALDLTDAPAPPSEDRRPWTALPLPAWIADHLEPTVDPYAGMEYGRRIVTWTLGVPSGVDPVTLYRNQYVWAHIEISERKAWRGEPLWLTAQRRPTHEASYQRVSFTRPALDAMSQTLVPSIVRYGFDRLWTEIVSARSGSGIARARDAQRDAERAARWHRDSADLAELMAEGRTTMRPIAGLGETALTTDDRDRRRKAVISVSTGRPEQIDVVAEIVCDGETVGWYTSGGQPIPLDDDLRNYWTPRSPR